MKVVFVASLIYLALVAFLSRKKLRELHPRRFFLETWRELDREARLARGEGAEAAAAGATTPVAGALESVSSETAAATPKKFDYRPLIAYTSFAFVLTMQEYFGDRGTFYKLRDRGLVLEWGGGVAGTPSHSITLLKAQTWLNSDRWGDLYALGWWVLTRAGGYLLPTLLLVKLWREKYRDYGLRTKGFLSHAWIYALFFGIVQLAVVLVSQTREFATYYPFYAHANRSWTDFFLWECMYALQFFALEFYFRGFLLFSSARSMGHGVVLAMVVPYCMIHFGKPMPETLGAILAGTVLGTLALKTRSIWSGFLIHVTVALSMDMAALLQTRGLPGGFRLPASWNF